MIDQLNDGSTLSSFGYVYEEDSDRQHVDDVVRYIINDAGEANALNVIMTLNQRMMAEIPKCINGKYTVDQYP